jgi:asparagine synthase (glutamine-hydrolysing)
VCGIAGIVRADPRTPVEEAALRRMARALRHRGPDGWGLARDHGAGLVSTRLAIFDPERGWQPMRGPAGSVLVYNGEVFNHPELRARLGDDAPLATGADTEVVLRLLEREGVAALEHLNGQFALAWWQPERRRLVLARDRFGIHPLHVAALDDGAGLAFASEAKGLFASGEVTGTPDLRGLDEAFALWGPQAPRTAFAGVSQLPPGGLLVWERGAVVEERRWWAPVHEPPRPEPDDTEALLRDSVRLRLRADVPVGAYLSGGLDSSLVCALAQQETDHRLRTFSIAFRDPAYDESAFQREAAEALGTLHHVVEVGASDIAEAFPAVVQQAETPLIRTAPVPLWLLARATREQGITVVATGEGADELFWGYDLFKEVALRSLAVDDPGRARELAAELYPWLREQGAGRGEGWVRSLLEAAAPDDPLGSHRSRVAAAGAVRGLYHADVRAELGAAEDPLDALLPSLPADLADWSPLERASLLECATLLPGYLLAAQGDRVALAHGVEARFPFLDDRVAAHAQRLPADRKLGPGLREKAALRDVAGRVLPASLAERTKQPYRAPEVAPFTGEDAPAWVAEALAPDALRATGIFDERRVGTLVRRAREGRARGMREGMALIAVLSTQVWEGQLCGRTADHPAETTDPRVRIDLAAERPLEAAA